MRDSPRFKTLRPYAVAVAAVIAAVALRLLMDPVIGVRSPFATAFFAVLLTAWYGGFRPALLATLLGGVLSCWALLPPRFEWSLYGAENQGGLALYAAVALGIALIGGAMHQARRAAEITSREAIVQRQQLEVTLHSIGDAVIATDARGRITSMNAVAEELTGWPLQDALARPLAEAFQIVNENSRQPVDNPVDTVLAEGRIVGLANHTVLIARDGAERPIDDSAAPIRDAAGNLLGVVLVFRDVSESRHAAVQLRRSELELSDFFENANVGLHWVGPDGIILRVNRAELDLLGYAREEYVGRHIAEFHADQPVIGDILSRLGAGERLDSYPARLFAKDGSIKHVLINSSVLWDGDRFVHTRCFTLDVTGRNQAATAQALLASVVESSEDAIVTKTLQGVITSWNSGAQRLFGYTADEAIGQPVTLIVPPERLDEEPQILERLRRGERVDHFETVRVAKDGRRLEISLSISPVRDASGTIIGAAKVARNMTAHHQAERAAHAAEQRLRLITDNVPALIAYIDKDYRYRLNNRAYETWFGVARDAVAGQHMREVLGEAAWEKLRPRVAAALAGQVVTFEDEIAYEHGGSRWIAASYVPQVNDTGEVEGIAVLVNDFTASKLAAEALRESQDRFRDLADNIAQFAWMADSTGWIFWYNQRWFDYTGITLEEMQGWGWQQVHHPDHVAAVTEKFRAHVEQGRTWEDTFPLRGRDGEYRWFLSRAVPIRDERGQVLRCCGTNTDITAQREAADALRSADRRKDEFLATLAHELRNPLAPIRTALEIMKREDIEAPVVEESRLTMDRQLTHLQRLVDDLLDISRITRDRLELRKERVELASVIHQAVETCRALATAARHELIVDLPPEPIYLNADAVRLAQIFSNLLNNSCKYTAPGGRISLTVERQAGDLVATVADSGIGIPPEMLPRVFDMFTQVQHGAALSQGGLGIGLTLVRRLVEMHGGTITAHSAGPGQGSEFVVRLPLLLESAPPIAAPAPSSDAAAATKRRILVVDDNRDAAKMLAMLLNLSGHDTHVEHDGLAAVDAAEAFRPELVLLDLGLPKLSGHDAARRIRQQPGGQAITLIALTGWGQDEDRRKSSDAGFDHHLVKPVNHAQLNQLIAELPQR